MPEASVAPEAAVADGNAVPPVAAPISAGEGTAAATAAVSAPPDPSLRRAGEAALPRVLAVYPDSSVLSLIRESIGAFTEAVVDTTPDARFGFELAMQRDYRLFFFGLAMPVLDGDRLYDFVAMAYSHCRPGARNVPGVVYLKGTATEVPQEVRRDARVKGILACPFEISRLLRCTETILSRKEIGT